MPARGVLRALFGALVVAGAAPTALGGQEALIVRGGWMFDVGRGSMVRNTAIVIGGGKLLELGADLPRQAPSPTVTIDLADDDFILPGLFDLHAHYEVDLLASGRVDEVRVNPVVYLANGVTSTFTAGESDPDSLVAARRRIESGEQIGPRLWNAGYRVGVGRQGRLREDASTADVFREVDYWAARGVGAFKVKGIGPDHLRAVIQRAHLHGLTVTGHLGSGYGGTVNPRDAIPMGIDRVEHYLGGDGFAPDRDPYESMARVDTASAEFKRIVALFLKHRVYFTPTIRAFGYTGTRTVGFEQWADERGIYTPYIQEVAAIHAAAGGTGSPRNDILQDAALRTVKAFYDAGGRDLIVLGTDSPGRGQYVQGFMVHRELEALVAAGLPPADALRAATLNAARALNVSDRLGSIEVGKFADLVVTKGNPLDDIRNTRRVHTVIKSGVTYDTRTLLRSVEGKLGPTSPAEARQWGRTNLTN